MIQQLPGQEGTGSPEISGFAEYSHEELMDHFYRMNGEDLTAGTALSVRLFEHMGIDVDPYATQLIGRDGHQIQEGDKSFTLADYVNYATKHHPEAVESILDALLTEPGTQEYEETSKAMLGWLNLSR